MISRKSASIYVLMMTLFNVAFGAKDVSGGLKAALKGKARDRHSKKLKSILKKPSKAHKYDYYSKFEETPEHTRQLGEFSSAINLKSKLRSSTTSSEFVKSGYGSWKSWTNYRGNWNVQCEDASFITRISSKTDKGFGTRADKRDRIWRFRCVNNGDRNTTCATDSNWSGTKKWVSKTCDLDHTMVGWTSKWEGDRVDRRFKFRCCQHSGLETNGAVSSSAQYGKLEDFNETLSDAEFLYNVGTGYSDSNNDRTWLFGYTTLSCKSFDGCSEVTCNNTDDVYVRCVHCGSGRYLNTTDVDHDTCPFCESGKWSAEGDNDCTDCAAGKYNNNTGQLACIACPVGKYADNTGLSSCKACPLGQYADEAGQTCWKACPLGQYADDEQGQLACIACPVGKYADNTGLSSCKACFMGQYADEAGQTSCKACPSGQYADKAGQTSCKEFCAPYCGYKPNLPSLPSPIIFKDGTS